jgi:hypothetical protein
MVTIESLRTKLSSSQRDVLTSMRDLDIELTESIPGGWWLENRRIDGRIGTALLRKVYITASSCGGDSIINYHINSDGRTALDKKRGDDDGVD